MRSTQCIINTQHRNCSVVSTNQPVTVILYFHNGLSHDHKLGWLHATQRNTQRAMKRAINVTPVRVSSFKTFVKLLLNALSVVKVCCKYRANWVNKSWALIWWKMNRSHFARGFQKGHVLHRCTVRHFCPKWYCSKQEILCLQSHVLVYIVYHKRPFLTAIHDIERARDPDKSALTELIGVTNSKGLFTLNWNKPSSKNLVKMH